MKERNNAWRKDGEKEGREGGRKEKTKHEICWKIQQNFHMIKEFYFCNIPTIIESRGQRGIYIPIFKMALLTVAKRSKNPMPFSKWLNK